jgi:hypothetical protein
VDVISADVTAVGTTRGDTTKAIGSTVNITTNMVKDLGNGMVGTLDIAADTVTITTGGVSVTDVIVATSVGDSVSTPAL